MAGHDRSRKGTARLTKEQSPSGPCKLLLPSYFTTWLSAAEVLALRFVLPVYTAVIERVPTAKAEVANVALWVDVFTAPAPSVDPT